MTYKRVIVGTDRSPTARKAEELGGRLAAAHEAQLVLIHAKEDPARVLTEEASDESADLIVVGSRGMSGASRLLGSVPNSVSHSAKCDVLIAKTTEGDVPKPYRKVLIGTDGSETAMQAARRGVDLCRRFNAEAVLFYAGHPATAPIVFAEARRELPAAEYKTRSAIGEPVAAICETAIAGDFDLIVLGNRGMRGKVPGPSVPDKVSHRAPCDLLIVRTVATSIDSLRKGEGAVVRINGDQKVAAFRDSDGKLHMLSPRCAHLGCIVGWNSSERTWDCPCHGSRYSATGEVIHGPAVRGLSPLGD